MIDSNNTDDAVLLEKFEDDASSVDTKTSKRALFDHERRVVKESRSSCHA